MKIIFTKKLPTLSQLPKKSILIYDRNLFNNEQVKTWIESFSFNYAVDAGESLKQLDAFQKHFSHILDLVGIMKVKEVTLISVGGGSVGDFVGFLASVFKRGVPLIHIPSTWLAAIDSAHGGKTALNCGGYKNQIGTYYSAEKIILCRDLLFTQPESRAQDAMGEVLKTALLQGKTLWKQISKEPKMSSNELWHYLKPLIAYKYQVVKMDPFEKKGQRLFLNFGHTYGHVFEASEKLSHGKAVNLGIQMALSFSVYKKILSAKEHAKINSAILIRSYLLTKEEVQKTLLNIKNISSFLLQDKKVTSDGYINFIFLKEIGKPLVRSIKIDELISFTQKYLSHS